MLEHPVEEARQKNFIFRWVNVAIREVTTTPAWGNLGIGMFRKVMVQGPCFGSC